MFFTLFQIITKGHADEMFRSGKGFISAEAFTIETEQSGEDAPTVLVINYRVDSRENLKDYFDNHAARLRESGLAT